jgi:hypothetical protein
MNAPTPASARFARLTVRNTMLLAVLAVGIAFLLLAGVMAFWREDAPKIEDSTVAGTGIRGDRLLAPLRPRCETCGVIERIRTIEAVGAAPASYEFAVRLPDGSLRFSGDPRRGEWQVGDKMQLLGGERASSASPP